MRCVGARHWLSLPTTRLVLRRKQLLVVGNGGCRRSLQAWFISPLPVFTFSLSSPAIASTCSGLKHARQVWTNLQSTSPISGSGAFEGYTLLIFWLLPCISVTSHTKPPFTSQAFTCGTCCFTRSCYTTWIFAPPTQSTAPSGHSQSKNSCTWLISCSCFCAFALVGPKRCCAVCPRGSSG